jgi:hypothetical protein
MARLKISPTYIAGNIFGQTLRRLATYRIHYRIQFRIVLKSAQQDWVVNMQEPSMIHKRSLRGKVFICVLVAVLGAFASLAVSSRPLFAQESNAQKPQQNSSATAHVGLPIDWTSRHILFTGGGSKENQAAASRDPHSWITAAIRGIRPPAERPNEERPDAERPDGELPDISILSGPHPAKPGPIRRDWAMPIGAGTVGQGEGPAKWSFNVNGTYNCTKDYVVYATNQSPASKKVNIIAFNNLYTGSSSTSCGSETAPTILFAYAAGSAGLIGSPVLSLDGTKIAFIEGGGTPTLDVLTWASGQGSISKGATPGTGGSSLVRLSYTNTTTAGCTARSSANTHSSPYVDYANDVAYVGDAQRLYRITGIFEGTPTLQYCITVNSSAAYLTAPVYDQITNQVFISDGNSVYSYTPGSTGFTPGNSILITSSGSFSGFGILSAPVVDVTNGFVYVFSPTDSTGNYAIVSQLDLGLSTQNVARIGPASTAFYTFYGDFDNAYFTSGPKSGAGTLYACGTQTGSSGGQQPSLYALSFSSPNGILNSTPAMSNDTNITGSTNPSENECSPLLTFYDGTNDRLFVGVGDNSNYSEGSNLVTQWDINSQLTSSSATPSATGPTEFGGTSAFVVDNTSAAPQAASIYFSSPLKDPSGNTCGVVYYCAIKLTQSGLQ